MGAARETEKDTTMATIGTFTSTGNGFTGTVRTLALNAKAKLVRVENPSDKGPHFRIFAGNVELGAAWQKTARDTERDYLSVKLDDPSFPAPIYATLIEVEGQEGLQLIWSAPAGIDGPPTLRPRRKAGPLLYVRALEAPGAGYRAWLACR
jgi:uncharacterized protein (DUF736 family)